MNLKLYGAKLMDNFEKLCKAMPYFDLRYQLCFMDNEPYINNELVPIFHKDSILTIDDLNTALTESEYPSNYVDVALHHRKVIDFAESLNLGFIFKLKKFNFPIKYEYLADTTLTQIALEKSKSEFAESNIRYLVDLYNRYYYNSKSKPRKNSKQAKDIVTIEADRYDMFYSYEICADYPHYSDLIDVINESMQFSIQDISKISNQNDFKEFKKKLKDVLYSYIEYFKHKRRRA